MPIRVVFCLFALLSFTLKAADTSAPRAQALQQMKDGNFKNAFEAFSRLALDPADDPKLAGEDLNNAANCLNRLGRTDEFDTFVEKAIAVHNGNWRLLQAAALCYARAPHHGYTIAGQFSRGYKRGQGRYSDATARDRGRSLQLLTLAMSKIANEPGQNDVAGFYFQFAQSMQNNRPAWQLQTLSNLAQLPDYNEPWYYYGAARGAPVEANDAPLFIQLPKSFETAASDGERWRWLLDQGAKAAPARSGEARFLFAQFLQAQFDVGTMRDQGYFRSADAGDTKDESGPYAVKTLSDDETIARLACGIRRFKLPDEFNFIRIFQQVTKDGGPFGEKSCAALAQSFEDRQQYDKAAECWRESIAKYGDNKDFKQGRLDQIVGNWCSFEETATQTAGKAASIGLRFRNGEKVSFEACAVKIPELLNDVKTYLKSRPNNLDWQALDIANIGFRLVQKNQTQYLGEKVAAWDLELKPRPGHFDSAITVHTPLQKAGAYLLTATMANGNTARAVIWVADTVLVKKPLDQGAFLYLADATTGAPVGGAKLDLFGYSQEWSGNGPQLETAESASATDENGEAVLSKAQADRNFNWIITATTPDGRFAHLGFTSIWRGQYHDAEYNRTRVFGVTDRPVYRPAQSVKFKVWLAHAKYDQTGGSAFANRNFPLSITNPKGEKILDKSCTADAWGGFDGELPLDKNATLGEYRINVTYPENFQPVTQTAVQFRVEEYKKPEYEVTVDAPTEPVALGEKITATVKARYYFGAPVADAKVKYKVLRTTHAAEWFPHDEWDWFYGPGYWWFQNDYTWYPGWRDWGAARPASRAWGWRQPAPPEVVSENETAIGADGTLKIEIDTAPAKAMFGQNDQQYQITAEVTDQSRRTITGSGLVLAARKPFKVHAWLDRGYYDVGDAVQAQFSARTLDQKPVKGKGVLKLLKLTYDADGKPVETAAQEWALDTDETGSARQQLKASESGQYRLSYTVADDKKREIEGGCIFCVRGEGFDGSQFRFNDLELVTDKREYQPGENVHLMVNTNRTGGTVLLFLRPANSVYLEPKLLRLKGKSQLETVAVAQKDMPNFFVEAVTVANGQVFTEVREIVVPPESRVLNVEVLPSAKELKPGEKAKVRIKLTDLAGAPVAAASSVITVYDKALEYISGGSNVPEIKSFFWKWRRSHYPQQENNLSTHSYNLTRQGEKAMAGLGVFGSFEREALRGDRPQGAAPGAVTSGPMACAPSAAKCENAFAAKDAAGGGFGGGGTGAEQETGDRQASGEKTPQGPAVAVRSNFADTAYWTAALNTDANGIGEFEMTMPENLTTWKLKAWTMSQGARVGQGEAEIITRKNLIVRLQAPRFFTQKDEVVLSANVHNYLKTRKDAEVSLELSGNCLEALDPLTQKISLDTNSEKRVDWRVRVANAGEAVVTVKALTDEESDAMRLTFPAQLHGMLKTDSFAGSIRPERESASIRFTVPRERIAAQSRLEVRYSPSLAAAMVDALPYLASYPYDSTDQTLDRFLPAAITQKVLQKLHVNLKDVKEKRTNLNAQEIGDDAGRAQRLGQGANPVFDEQEITAMVQANLERLQAMQCGDGGWGWFSGWGEQSTPFNTAYVVHGLQIARENGVALPPGVLERGVAWLRNHQLQQLARLKLAEGAPNFKKAADNLDAFAYMVLADASVNDPEMRDFLYRDRTELAVYAKCMFALALHRQQQPDKLAMLCRNIEQFLVQDEENQTAHLRLPENNSWWCWYGGECESQAYCLKLLTLTEPKSERTARLAKYLINNRRHATYWNSTRDTAIAIEALADFVKASGEDNPNLTLSIYLDGQKVKDASISAANLFTFDNKFVLTGDKLSAGAHLLEFRKQGAGPLYFNAYCTNFTLEDAIGKAGLEIKVQRKCYRLKPADRTVETEGARGRAVSQKIEKYEREPLENLAALKSGDLVEVELEIESKNDYEYVLFEDMKAAGFEPMFVRSGYNDNDMGAYMELRDERVCFFVRQLARGKHSVSYRLRAEIPGTFSALPARASAIYAPELKANSDEIKLRVTD